MWKSSKLNFILPKANALHFPKPNPENITRTLNLQRRNISKTGTSSIANNQSRKQSTSSSNAKKTYHRLFVFGAGKSGQLGTGEQEDSLIPVPIPFFDNLKTRFLDICATWTHTLAVTEDVSFSKAGKYLKRAILFSFFETSIMYMDGVKMIVGN